ncbi:hypothetical protein GE09DRAFT_1048554 [Coniochaeta sp. 2T2.1]|nr:hypothetical protein GE09DRAFT_1048554 [Coniochaeta sp. 2T2.1]
MSSTQHASDEQRAADVMPPSTRARMSPFQIYNDSLPASVQPETPQNLPEARHRSRLHGAYTAPARRESPLELSTPTTSRGWRQEARQNPTPAELQTPGFLGLYGGIENTDEVALFEEAESAVEARASRMGDSLSFDL